MENYNISKLPALVFGSGVSKGIGAQLKNLELKNCLIITDEGIVKLGIANRIAGYIKEEGIDCQIFDKVLPDPPDTVCLEIGELIKKEAFNCVIGLGGGSPMDVAKAACLIAGIPEKIEDLHEYGGTGTKMKASYKSPCTLIEIPTTSGTGAESTGSAVISSTLHQLKFSFMNPNIAADMAIVDPEFTLGMPAMPTVNCGLDILAHAIEIVVGCATSEYSNLVLFECIKKAWRWLPVAVSEPNNKEAREQLSWAAHNALANGGGPNGHAVGHAIGSLYHIVHGQAVIMVLPTVIRHFAQTSQDRIAALADIIGVPVTSDAQETADRVARQILEYYKSLGVKPFYETIREKGYDDDEETFAKKAVHLILDDFKSRLWNPPIHTGDTYSKIEKLCHSIYNDR